MTSTNTSNNLDTTAQLGILAVKSHHVQNLSLCWNARCADVPRLTFSREQTRIYAITHDCTQVRSCVTTGVADQVAQVVTRENA